MSCVDILLSFIIGISSGIISGLMVDWFIKRREKIRLESIRNRILDDIIGDIKMYIQLFNNKPFNIEPIRFLNNKNKNNQIETPNKIDSLVKEIKKINGLTVIKNKTIDSIPIILQLKSHLAKIIDNEFYFKDNILLTDEQVEKTNIVIKNIDFYLNIETNNCNFDGITMTLTDFLNEIKDIN